MVIRNAMRVCLSPRDTKAVRVTKVVFLLLRSYLLKLNCKEAWWGLTWKKSPAATRCTPGWCWRIFWKHKNHELVFWFFKKCNRVNIRRFSNEARLVVYQLHKIRILKSLNHIKGEEGTNVCGGINGVFYY